MAPTSSLGTETGHLAVSSIRRGAPRGRNWKAANTRSVFSFVHDDVCVLFSLVHEGGAGYIAGDLGDVAGASVRASQRRFLS
jgi:hypothetical protein